MVPQLSGARAVMNHSGHRSTQLALIFVLAAALGVAACGRKGPPEPPPITAPSGTPGANAATDPQPPNKRILLDVLLD
jgi:predicted small lipoprotein YifL